jgi:hypothetical protein
MSSVMRWVKSLYWRFNRIGALLFAIATLLLLMCPAGFSTKKITITFGPDSDGVVTSITYPANWPVFVAGPFFVVYPLAMVTGSFLQGRDLYSPKFTVRTLWVLSLWILSLPSILSYAFLSYAFYWI